MRITIKDEDADLYDVIDLDTGKRIPLVQWADDEIGEYEVFVKNEIGNIEYIKEDNKLIPVRILKKGNIKLVRKEKESITTCKKLKKIIREEVDEINENLENLRSKFENLKDKINDKIEGLLGILHKEGK